MATGRILKRQEVLYFSPSKNNKVWFEKLEDGQLLEIATSYYMSRARIIFKNWGFELAHDSYLTKKRGYRLYRAVKIREKEETIQETLTFDPAELVGH